MPMGEKYKQELTSCGPMGGKDGNFEVFLPWAWNKGVTISV
jgi:hypothetical protein